MRGSGIVKDLEYTKKQYNLDANIRRYSEAIEEVGLWNSEKKIFEKYINKNDKILDLGCGAGRTTINLYMSGYTNITGLDIADKLIDFAKKYSSSHNLDINFVVGDATKLEYEDNSFDVVIFSFNGMQCIPGLENRRNVLKEVYRVLKPGGYYIFTAHDRHDPKCPQYLPFWEKIENDWKNGINESGVECLGDLITTDPAGEEAFIHFSTIDELKDFISEQPFEIVEYDYSYKIADEDEKTKDFSGDTVFWILRK